MSRHRAGSPPAAPHPPAPARRSPPRGGGGECDPWVDPLLCRPAPHRSKRRRWAGAAALAGCAGGLLWWYRGRQWQSPYEHMRPENQRLIGLLRESLWRNMQGSFGKSATMSFVQDGEINRLANITTSDFTDHYLTSQPFVLSNPDVRCTKNPWTLEFIESAAGDDVVGVETSASNRFYSGKALTEVQMSVRDFLEEFRKPNLTERLYLAEKNVNQMPGLERDVEELPFSSDFQLDVTQVWIGAGGQVAPIHMDQWDNLVCQIEGTREVTLFDPLQSDRMYPGSGADRFFSQVDPVNPDHARFPRFADAERFHVTLQAGEILYIPAHWWHLVRSQDSVNIAVNFWYMPSLLGEMLVDILLPDPEPPDDDDEEQPPFGGH